MVEKKQRPQRGLPAGFSLVEVLVALSISGLFLATLTGAWYFSTKSFKEENLRGRLRFDLHKAMERIKEDVRMTNGNNLVFYPSSASTYTALSVPKATANGSGFYTLSSSAVSWDKTVIYHLYDNGGTQELRRSVFGSYLSTTAARQSQLDALVLAGSDASASMTVLASGDEVTLEITPTSPTFDGYNSSLDLSENTSFGSVYMTAGNHLVRFIVAGKNDSSSGYQMGFDQLSLNPSGGGHEAEALTVNATSGGSASDEDMSPYGNDGLWYGNYQKAFSSAAAGNYVEFQIYYDNWLESNFSDVTHSYTEVYGTEPAVRVASREDQTLLPVWKADLQTGADAADNASFQDNTVRNIISASSLTGGGQMVRFKFTASEASGPLTIHEAHFGARSVANPYDFSGSTSQLYFGNATIGPGDSDGTGATGSTGSISITIPQGHYVWSNWMSWTVSSPSSTDYLLSMVIENDAASGNEAEWDGGGAVQSYVLSGGAIPTGSWSAEGYASDASIHALAEIAAWTSTGTVTSQIYDTHMTSPSFGTLTWSTNGSGTYIFKVRSSADSDMTGATAWSAVSTHSSSPAALGVAGARYVQWQATLDTASPYSAYPEIDDVMITWPGQTGIVDVGGYYTKRPNYGIFSVQVDGSSLVNALEVQLTAMREFQGREYEEEQAAEVRARNTGK
jgi:prepilin-type N-terminal cleavage/methylation domain-containing protein